MLGKMLLQIQAVIEAKEIFSTSIFGALKLIAESMELTAYGTVKNLF